ncbi:MAG: hypothetical protein AB8G17_21740 [Gammaproteobacteria bacterium]
MTTSPAMAQAQGFTDFADFAAAVGALNGPAESQDFDSFSDGTIIPSGASVDGIRPTYDFGGVQLEVRKVSDSSTFATSSDPNFLASDDVGVLQGGDDITFSSESFVNAFGLRVSIADEVLPGEVTLTAGGVTVSLDPDDVQDVLDDGASEYFLGVVDPEISFSTAQLRTGMGGFFLFVVDDLFTGRAPDIDADVVADAADNCVLANNAAQLDTDGDNIGNACDADIGQPNNCFVNAVDLGVLRAAFFSTPGSANWNPDADFNGDGTVNIQDLGVMRAAFFGVPGPSGLPNACASSSSSSLIEGQK